MLDNAREGSWIQTRSGKKFYPLDPRPEDVDLNDIAHALSNICRYTGHCRSFYSVAQHSVLVSRALPAEYRLWGLLHDASEAYICDIARPVKPHLANYKQIEEGIMFAVIERFGLSPFMPEEVHRVDNAILQDEAQQLMNDPKDWQLPEPALGIFIEPWSPEFARREFLREFRMIQMTRYCNA